MSGRHLFVMDPIQGIDPSHDTTYVIMQEVERRGAEVWWSQSLDLHLTHDSFRVNARHVSVLEGDRYEHFRTIRRDEQRLADFDMVWMREDPPFDSQYLFSTYMLEHARVPVMNDPRGIRDSNEKMLIMEFPDHGAPTWVGSRPGAARSFLERIGGRGVGKPLAGYGGEGVFRLTLGDPNLSALLEQLTRKGNQTIMIQQYLEGVEGEGDRRVIVLGGEPIGALSRQPAEGDFRCNLHSGGSATGTGVRPDEEELCQSIKPALLKRGLHLVGLDLIDGLLTEINVTSPTCVQEINELAGVALEEEIVSYAEQELLQETAGASSSISSG